MKTETRTKKQSPALSPALIGFAALGAYFAVLLVGSLLNGDKMSILAPKFIIYMNPLTYAIAWLLTAAALVAYGAISKPLVYRFTWIASFLYALRTAMAGGSYYLTFAMCGLVAVMTYACGKVFKHLLNLGGLEAMEKINQEKAAVLYDFLDSSSLFKGTVDKEFRSLMNIPFSAGSAELDAALINTQVAYTTPFDVNDTFADIFETFIEGKA